MIQIFCFQQEVQCKGSNNKTAGNQQYIASSLLRFLSVENPHINDPYKPKQAILRVIYQDRYQQQYLYK
jgi:hypothetical protein